MSQQVLDTVPSQLLYYSHGKVPKGSTGRELYSQAKLQIDFLQNKFLLERVATARGLLNTQALLSAAMELLDFTLMFWMNRDQLMAYVFYFDWIVSLDCSNNSS
jgi:hypothetical protein